VRRNPQPGEQNTVKHVEWMSGKADRSRRTAWLRATMRRVDRRNYALVASRLRNQRRRHIAETRAGCVGEHAEDAWSLSEATPSACRSDAVDTPEYDARANTVSAGLSGDTCASQHLERQRGRNERPRFSRVFSRSPFLPQSVDPGSSVKDLEVAGYPQFAALALPDSR
jgi:hypothetical protein